jgi:hypothetical protein
VEKHVFFLCTYTRLTEASPDLAEL